MSPEAKQLVKDTWRQVEPGADQAAELFYGRLFELDPGLRPLFDGTDFREQGRKLMQTLGVAVAGLDRLEQLVPALQQLARRHVSYGVRDEHYATVGAALVWTLEQGLGPAFTPAARQAWTDLYAMVSGVMRDAAADPVPA